MPHKFCCFGLLILLAIAVALYPVAASASTITINSITVTNEWQLGESDTGAILNGAAAATTPDDLGGWNLTGVNTGSTAAVYTAGASGRSAPAHWR